MCTFCNSAKGMGEVGGGGFEGERENFHQRKFQFLLNQFLFFSGSITDAAI